MDNELKKYEKNTNFLLTKLPELPSSLIQPKKVVPFLSPTELVPSIQDSQKTNNWEKATAAVWSSMILSIVPKPKLSWEDYIEISKKVKNVPGKESGPWKDIVDKIKNVILKHLKDNNKTEILSKIEKTPPLPGPPPPLPGPPPPLPGPPPPLPGPPPQEEDLSKTNSTGKNVPSPPPSSDKSNKTVPILSYTEWRPSVMDGKKTNKWEKPTAAVWSLMIQTINPKPKLSWDDYIEISKKVKNIPGKENDSYKDIVSKIKNVILKHLKDNDRKEILSKLPKISPPSPDPSKQQPKTTSSGNVPPPEEEKEKEKEEKKEDVASKTELNKEEIKKIDKSEDEVVKELEERLNKLVDDPPNIEGSAKATNKKKPSNDENKGKDTGGIPVDNPEEESKESDVKSKGEPLKQVTARFWWSAEQDPNGRVEVYTKITQALMNGFIK